MHDLYPHALVMWKTLYIVRFETLYSYQKSLKFGEAWMRGRYKFSYILTIVIYEIPTKHLDLDNQFVGGSCQ